MLQTKFYRKSKHTFCNIKTIVTLGLGVQGKLINPEHN